MIKLIVKHTIFKNFNKKCFGMAWWLVGVRYRLLFFVIFAIALSMAVVLVTPVEIAYLCDGVGSSTSACVSCILFYIVFLCALRMFYVRFRSTIYNFVYDIEADIYYNHYTMKGRALARDDMEKFHSDDWGLYYLVRMARTNGCCYDVCFKMLKLIGEGSVIFAGITSFPDECENNESRTMHALYARNGWVFDSCSTRQYPVDEYHKICDSLIYGEFDSSIITESSTGEFMKRIYDDLKKWADDNDVYFSYNFKDEDESR